LCYNEAVIVAGDFVAFVHEKKTVVAFDLVEVEWKEKIVPVIVNIVAAG
jgi:hypothetical protein